MTVAPVYSGVEDRTRGVFRIARIDGSEEEHPASRVTYIKADAYDTARDAFDLVDAVDEETGGWLRLTAPPFRHWDLQKVLKSRGVRAYEADVRSLRRYLSEKNELRIATATRDIYVDIETDDRHPFAEQLEGEARILSIAWAKGEEGEVHFQRLQAFTDSAEEQLLLDFLRAASDCHLVIGWGLDRFDWPIIRERCKRLGIRFPWWKLVPLDMLEVWRKHFKRGESGDQKVSFALDAISASVLNERKMDLRAMLRESGVDLGSSRVYVYRAWLERPELLRLYNCRDVELMQLLELRKHFLGLQKTLASLCRTLPTSRSLYSTELADGVFLRVGRRRGVHFATKIRPKDDEIFEKAQGATVGDILPGLHRDVHMLDFASLYPSIMLSWNMSPETCLGYDKPDDAVKAVRAENGAWFRTDVRGVFPEVIDRFVKRRAEAKAHAKAAKTEEELIDRTNTQEGYKVFCNALYGMTLSRWSRYYNVALGEGVTANGRALLAMLCDTIEQQGGVVVMSDTDGAGGTGFNPMQACATMDQYIDRWSTDLVLPHNTLRLEHETTFTTLAILKKKRYAGIATFYKGATLDVPKIEPKGLEMMRSDGCQFMRDLQRTIVEGFLREGHDASWARDLMLRARDDCLSGKVELEKIVVRKTLSKEPDEYKSVTAHVQVAQWLGDEGKEVWPGMKIPYVIVGRDGNKQRAVHPDAFDGNYAADIYWNDLIATPIERVLEIFYPEHKWDDLGIARSTSQESFGFNPPPVPRREPKLRKREEETKMQRSKSKDKPEPVEGLNVYVVGGASKRHVNRLRESVENHPGQDCIAVFVETEDGWVSVDVSNGSRKNWRCDGREVSRDLKKIKRLDCVFVSPSQGRLL